MNMHSTFTPAPFHIGQGFCDRNGRAWIVKIEREQARRSFLIGGPSPMAAIEWTITVVRESGTISEMDEHTVARHMDSHPIPACEDPAALLAQALDKRERDRAAYRESAERARIAGEAARAELERLKPAWAQCAIVATEEIDDCDSMTDYFNVKRGRRVVIGWSKHKRDLFPELRKAAATFEETAHLADAPASAEHREKYSMGGGYYLKDGNRYSTGWKVAKESFAYCACAELEFSDAARGLDATPTDAETPATISGGNSSGLFAIEKHRHTKKGFDMWICTLAERVERDDFDRFLQAAKALGGWYSRPWGGTPGGFAFKVEAKALEFIGADGGDTPPPTDGNRPEWRI